MADSERTLADRLFLGFACLALLGAVIYRATNAERSPAVNSSLAHLNASSQSVAISPLMGAELTQKYG